MLNAELVWIADGINFFNYTGNQSTQIYLRVNRFNRFIYLFNELTTFHLQFLTDYYLRTHKSDVHLADQLELLSLKPMRRHPMKESWFSTEMKNQHQTPTVSEYWHWLVRIEPWKTKTNCNLQVVLELQNQSGYLRGPIWQHRMASIT